MKLLLRLISTLSALVLLLHFNNCSNINDTTGFDTTSPLSACAPSDPNTHNLINAAPPNVNCTLPDLNNMMIQPVGGDRVIGAGVADFQVGGSCNEGNYPLNVVAWQLTLDGQVVRHSGMINTRGTTSNTSCYQGHFTSFVDLNKLSSGDQVDRTGLTNNDDCPHQYMLIMTITGYDTKGNPYQNAANGTITIPLDPNWTKPSGANCNN